MWLLSYLCDCSQRRWCRLHRASSSWCFYHLDQAGGIMWNTRCVSGHFSKAQYIAGVQILILFSHCVTYLLRKEDLFNFAQDWPVFYAGPPRPPWPHSCDLQFTTSTEHLSPCSLLGLCWAWNAERYRVPCGPPSCCVLSSIAPYWLSWWKAVLHLLVCSRNIVMFTQKILKSFRWSKPEYPQVYPRLGSP